MSDDLVKRLRHAAKFGGIYGEAADRIEELEGLNKEMHDNHHVRLEELEDKIKLQLAYIEELRK